MRSPSVGRSNLPMVTIRSPTSTSRGCSGCFLAKARRAARQLGALLGGLLDQLRDRGEMGTVGDAVGEDLDRAHDHGQHIVEVVRNRL